MRSRPASRRSAAQRRRDTARLERAHASREYVLGDKSGVDAKQPLEAGEKQAAADEQHERERNLRDDECAPDVSRAAPGCAAAAFLPQDAAQAGARQMHGGRGANDEAEEKRQAQRKAEDDAVHPDLVRRGRSDSPTHSRASRLQNPTSNPRTPPTTVSSVGFGDELPGDPAAPRADGAARGQFLHAPARAHERQVGDVDGGYQDDEEHATPEQQSARTSRTRSASSGTIRVVYPRLDQRRLERTRALHDLRVQRVDLRLCLIERHASCEPCNLLVVLAVAAILRAILRAEGDRNEDTNIRVGKWKPSGSTPTMS